MGCGTGDRPRLSVVLGAPLTTRAPVERGAGRPDVVVVEGALPWWCIGWPYGDCCGCGCCCCGDVAGFADRGTGTPPFPTLPPAAATARAIDATLKTPPCAALLLAVPLAAPADEC